jgi:filamentous hemagglutinin family protein
LKITLQGKIMKRLIDYSSCFRILKGGKVSLVVSAMLGGATISFAAPTGGAVTSGTANISQSGTVTNITQSTSKASINWQSFSIASNETVNFIQPNSSSITLNRVIGNERSVIDGVLNANGQVWLLNSNGVLFGKNASINTAGLLATTAQLSDTDFQNENYNFKNATANSVINEGTITIKDSGSVILASNEVRNSGTIKAVKGKVHLVGTDSYSLNLNGNSLVNLKIDKGVLDAMVENSGHIIADGGEIYLTTNAVNELLKGVVNNTGIIEANSLDGLAGHVEIFAHGGTASIDGTIEAQGGFVETSAKDLGVKSTAQIKTAHWLIDPVNIIISSAGEDDLSGAAINAIAIENALTTGDVELQADEDITVNQDISWEEATRLTLNAGTSIFINSEITALNNNGQLALYYSQYAEDGVPDDDYYINAPINLKAGDNFFTRKGNAESNEITWRVITDADAMQNMDLSDTSNYALGTDLDFDGINWTSIGTLGDKFSGNFEGFNHTISNLTINRPTEDYIGLFGVTATDSTIKNLGLINVDITGSSHIGAIAAQNGGTIFNAYSTGTVKSNGSYVGGLVAENFGDIEDSYSFVNVEGSSLTVGGLVGQNGGGNIKLSFATGDVIASSATYVGGLVGLNEANIEDSFALGNVTGKEAVGGFVGQQTSTGTITTSYSTGKVIGTVSSKTGGFLGVNFEYNNNGNYGTITNSYWDSDSSEQSIGIGTSNNSGTIQTVNAVKSSTETVNAFNQATYASFDFINDWYIIEGDTRPMLRSMHTKYITNQYQLQLMNMDLSADYTLKNDIDLSNTKTKQSDIWNIAKGWSPIGISSNRFTGTFNGGENIIKNMYINRSSTTNNGFFGYTGTNSTISNIGVTNADITGFQNVGVLVGTSNSTIKNSYSTGEVTGRYFIGGLVGDNNTEGSILYSYSNANVNIIDSSAGGLVGVNNAYISDSYATGDVIGINNLGGLVGINRETCMIENSYSIGTISGTGERLGGLIGLDTIGEDTNSFWDITTSGQATSDGGTGKTTQEMKNITTFSEEGWDISDDGSGVSKYPYLENGAWKIGVVGTSSSASSSSNTTTTQQEKVADIITPILNGTRTVVNVPQIKTPQAVSPAPRVQAQTTMAANMELGNARIVSTANVGEQPSQVVSLGELQQANSVAGAGTEVRVPLSQNSIVDLVNGGVNLPAGVDQQFFVVANDEN